MTTFLGSYERPKRTVAGETTRVGKLTGLSDDSMMGTVELAGEVFELPVAQAKYRLGAYVSVLESQSKPRRVIGPVSARPEGLDETEPLPDPVVGQVDSAPRELSEAEAQAIQDTADGLVQAQADLEDTQGLLDAIGASDGPEGVAEALTDYLAVPLDQITVVDNRGADGQVVANLYDSIIVDGLLAASEIITGGMLADGAVTARTLNVVPESGSGGMELQPPGLRIIPSDAEAGTAVSLRVDEPNWLAFAQDGVTTFSVSPEGVVVAQDIAANESLKYRGVELEERLSEPARGVITRTMLSRDLISDGNWALLGEVKVTPEPGRAYRVIVEAQARASTRRSTQVAVKWVNNPGFSRAWPVPAWNDNTDIGGTQPASVVGVYEFEYGDVPLGVGGFATLQLYGQSRNAGSQVRFLGWGSEFGGTSRTGMTLEDYGRASGLVMQAGSQPPLIGMGGTPAPPSGDGGSALERTTPYPSNGFRTFPVSGVRHVRADKSVVQGYTSGVHSTGHWYFPSVTSALNGATGMSGKLHLRNEHTYNSTGMTVGLWAHNYASAQGSFGVATKIGDYQVSRRGHLIVDLPANILNGLKSGTVKGFGISHGTTTSRDWYGYFSPNATLELTYTK